VRNPAGERPTAKLETANGYRLTADGTIMAVRLIDKLQNATTNHYIT
jgi:hypothetical protein